MPMLNHDSLLCQQVAAEDAQEMARLLDVKMQSVVANYRRGAGPQGTSGCSLTDAAPSNGEGGRTRERTEETQ